MSEYRERLFSKMVKAGRGRTYFFDVKQAKNNEKYLVISESHLNEKGDRDRAHLLVFHKDIPGFVEAVKDSVNFIGAQA